MQAISVYQSNSLIFTGVHAEKLPTLVNVQVILNVVSWICMASRIQVYMYNVALYACTLYSVRVLCYYCHLYIFSFITFIVKVGSTSLQNIFVL